jgi:ATP-binding cassette subfamily F protein 3
MLKLNQISLEFADRILFNQVDLFFGENDKVGLVGKNGAGKSTLLKVIMGIQPISGGKVIAPKDFTLGYLPQDLDFDSDLSVKDEVMKAFEVTLALEAQLENITKEVETRTDYESDSYSELLEDLNTVSLQLGMYDIDSQSEQLERVLLGLGFSREDLDRPMTEFSGGWKMRIALAKILLRKPSLILLDEPTNHLDIDSVEWLETYLKNYPGGVILISHDRQFLDQVTNRTVEIINGKTFDYPAAYTRFVELRTDIIQKQREAKKNQEKDIKQTEALINKFRAKSSKAAFAQGLMKKLDKMDIIEIDEEDNSAMRFRFPPSPRSGKVVVEAENLSKAYGDKQILNGLDFELIRGDRVALVGKNGVGKTTLTKILTGLTSYDGKCELGTQVDIGYYSQNQSEELPVKSTALEVIDAEATGEYRARVRSLLGAFMFQGDDVHKQVSVLSGGEKARLALCKLLLHKFNFLLLDEPTNHLDMRSKDVLKEALMGFDGTLLVVSHDRDFLKGLTDKVMEIKDGSITIFPGDISEFLDQKKADSIREFERVKKQNVKPAVEKKSNEKERWKVSKKIGTLEKDIDELEKGIEALKLESENLDFSDQDAVKKHMEGLKQKERKLERKMEEWENYSDKLNAL